MKKNRVKNIVITGATRGLGLSHSVYLAKCGYNIALVDLSEDVCSVYNELKNIEELLEKLNISSKAKFYSCDLTNIDETRETFKKIEIEFKSIEGAVFNAGGDTTGKDKNVSGGKPSNNTIMIDIEDHDIIFDRNYRTCLNSFQSIIPILKQNKYGKIITTSSVSAGYGVTKETAYSAAKAAIMHLTRSAAAELRDYDICINCISPGPIMTGRFKNTLKNRSSNDLIKINNGKSFLTKVADPIQISYLIEFLLSKKSDYISGQVIRIDGGQFTTPL